MSGKSTWALRLATSPDASRLKVFPQQTGGFTQGAEIPFPALRFGGVVEGVVLAVGLGHHQLTLDAFC